MIAVYFIADTQFIHPADPARGDQAVLPKPQGLRPFPCPLGGKGLVYSLRWGTEWTVTEHSLASRREAGKLNEGGVGGVWWEWRVCGEGRGGR